MMRDSLQTMIRTARAMKMKLMTMKMSLRPRKKTFNEEPRRTLPAGKCSGVVTIPAMGPWPDLI